MYRAEAKIIFKRKKVKFKIVKYPCQDTQCNALTNFHRRLSCLYCVPLNLNSPIFMLGMGKCGKFYHENDFVSEYGM